MHLASCMMQDLRNPQSAFVAARLASPVSAQPTERAFSVRGRAPPCSGLALARALTRQWARRRLQPPRSHLYITRTLYLERIHIYLLEAIAPRPPPQHLILAFPTIDSEMATDVVFYQPVHRYVNKTDRERRASTHDADLSVGIHGGCIVCTASPLPLQACRRTYHQRRRATSTKHLSLQLLPYPFWCTVLGKPCVRC